MIGINLVDLIRALWIDKYAKDNHARKYRKRCKRRYKKE